MSAAEAKKLKSKQRKQQMREQQEKQKQIEAERRKKESQRNRNKDDAEEEKTKEEEIVADKLERVCLDASFQHTHSLLFCLQCEKPLEEAMRFLQPLQDFSSNFLETHYLGFEVYYRRSKATDRSRRASNGSDCSRETSLDATLFETNGQVECQPRETSFVSDEIPSLG